MTRNETIYIHRSCRSFTGTPVHAATIETLKAFGMKSLYPDIDVLWGIVPGNLVKGICLWTTPQRITICSEEADPILL